MWFVVDCNKIRDAAKGYKLTQGETIKLGRVRYAIKQVCGFTDDEEPKTAPVFHPEPVQGEHRVCRVCLVDDEGIEPMISPCNCGGTMKYVHLSCFRIWIQSRTSTKISDNSISYHVKPLTCEISRCPISPVIRVQNQDVDLLDMQKVEPPFITLESKSSDKNEYSIHLISLNNKNNVRLGRGHDSDIRISDISVSRCHAVIRYSNGEFFLEDNSSKFGSLVEIPEMEINKTTPLACIQMGRTLMLFTLSSATEVLDNSIEDTDEEQ
jgi:hypothetical protein